MAAETWEKLGKPLLYPGQRICPTCKGTGINPILVTHVCPKCNGETVIGTGYTTATNL